MVNFILLFFRTLALENIAKILTTAPRLIDKGTHQGKSCSKNLDEAFCILKGTGVLIEKTLMYIFSKIQLFEVQPCADPDSYVRGWRADNSTTLNDDLVAL